MSLVLARRALGGDPQGERRLAPAGVGLRGLDVGRGLALPRPHSGIQRACDS